ncbi:MAG: hypothetical protein P4L16_02735 [Chlamydiales bacterium]|nr:hypothetical protein [Chlamydiales bacterium]
MSEKQLGFRDWYFVAFIGSILLVVFGLSFHSSYGSDYTLEEEIHELKPKKIIEITVKGAVKFPGVYKVQEGVLLQEVLENAKLLEAADIRRLKLSSAIKKNKTVVVPFSVVFL